MNITFRPCVSDDDYAKTSLFLLERKFELHPSFSTLGMVELLYAYMTQGSLHLGSLPDGRIISGTAFYHGTPERDFTDKNVALIDIAILDKGYRGTRTFLYGLDYLINWIHQQHTEVEEVRFVALSDNAYLCKLYAKFAASAYKREGRIGEETVFIVNISRIGGILKRFRRI